YLASLITLICCAGTVVPLYLLGRCAMPASAAWASAGLWPLVPAANLFQPDADTAYPLISTSAVALAVWAVKRSQGQRSLVPGLFLGLAAGVVLAKGIVFTLAFLPIGLIVALVILPARDLTPGRKAALLLSVGAGFLLVIALGWVITGANPVTIWTWNLKNHA